MKGEIGKGSQSMRGVPRSEKDEDEGTPFGGRIKYSLRGGALELKGYSKEGRKEKWDIFATEPWRPELHGIRSER